MKSKSRGMTLIEVAMALSIFTASGLALINAASEQVNATKHLQEKTFSLWVADNKLQELRLNNVWPEFKWVKQQVKLGERTWYVRWRGSQIPKAPRLRKLEVEVHKDKSYGHALAVQSTYVAL